MQFPFLPVGVKWKVVKNVHCPLLLINTGLMSIDPLTKRLLQKHRPLSCSKKRGKHALSPRSLTESSAERGKHALSPRSLTESSAERGKHALSPRSLTESSAERGKHALSPRSLTESSAERGKHALSPRSLTESSAESELSRLDTHWDGLCGLVLITSSENDEKEGCETWSALPFWRSHCLDFWASRFGVIAVYRWMCHEYRKLNQPPSLCSVCLMRMQAPAVLIQYFKLTQAVRTDPYAKMEMLAWTFDIYIHVMITYNIYILL